MTNDLHQDTTLSDEAPSAAPDASGDAFPAEIVPQDAAPEPESEPEIEPAHAAAPEHAGSSWEDDESSVTLFLRSACALLIAGFLAWAQNGPPQSQVLINPGTEWGRWIWLSVVANFLLPLGIVWMFFGQGLRRPAWLREQKHNAWNYGWDFGNWKRHFKLAGTMFLFMLPFLVIASRNPETRSFYHTFFPIVSDARTLLWLLGTLVIYMLCWEWFFRGFLLFGLAQGMGPYVAIILQAIVFGFAHSGKPPAEMASSFAGGLVLGTVAWREKSFAPAFYTHALIHVAWAILVLY